MKTLALVLTAVMSAPSAAQAEPISEAARPERVVMLYIDGLHPDAIDRFELETLAAMRKRGASAEEGVMPYPMHPTVGDYGDWHTTSFPNVATLAGTVFLEERPTFLQHRFTEDGVTVHAAGSSSYRSLNDGFDYALTQSGTTDAELVDFYVDAFEREGDVVFARIMLQEAGGAGRVQSGKNLSDDPWSQDVFAEGSPYGEALVRADAEIARLRDFLDREGALASTLFVLMGDGQSPHGWHLTLDPESQRTPIVFDGPGVKAGTRIPYAETIDVAPTIAAVMGVAPPNEDGGTGRVLTGLLPGGDRLTHPRPLARMNEQIREHERLRARATLAAADDPAMNLLLMELDHEGLSEHQFCSPERVMDWHEAGSLEAIIDSNQSVLTILDAALSEGTYPFTASRSH